MSFNANKISKKTERNEKKRKKEHLAEIKDKIKTSVNLGYSYTWTPFMEEDEKEYLINRGFTVRRSDTTGNWKISWGKEK